MLLVAVALARASSGSVSISYILLVLWMLSYFHTMGPKGTYPVLRTG